MPHKIPGIEIPDSVYRIPKNYSGLIIVSDVDRTYLNTEIHSIGGLLKAAFERPERKSNVPGFSLLLRALRRGAMEVPQKSPLFFLSASPPQMGATLRSKMEFDGIEHEGLILKDQLRHVRSGEFKKLKEQLGYKLGALLSLWYFLPKTARLVLFGDDSESDAIVFTIFSLVTSGQISGKALYDFLLALGVYRQEAIRVAWLSRQFEKSPNNPILAAFINLDLNLAPTVFGSYAPFFYATDNTLQAAAVAYENGMIRMKAVVSIAREFLLRYDWGSNEIEEALLMGCRKYLYSKKTALEISGALLGVEILNHPLEKSALFFDIEKTLKNYLPRCWGAEPPKHSLEEWKRIFLSKSF